MELQYFAGSVAGLDAKPNPDRLLLLVWFWHHHRGAAYVTAETLAESYRALHYSPQRIGRDLERLVARRPAVLLKSREGYSLESRLRAQFDHEYGEAPEQIAVSKLLNDLPDKLTSEAQRTFLVEALACYRIKAFRASIVMTWIMTFDHLLEWLLVDASRLASFNARIVIRYPKKKDVQISGRDDFEELKESEIVAIASSAGLISGGITKVLNKELDRRNSAAHPSTLIMTEHQASDAITDLVNNVVLKLS